MKKKRTKKEKVPDFLRNISKAEVIEEYFPLQQHIPNRFRKKYFRFQIIYKRKNNNILSSGRFRNIEATNISLKNFLKGSFEACFGNVNNKGK